MESVREPMDTEMVEVTPDVLSIQENPRRNESVMYSQSMKMNFS